MKAKLLAKILLSAAIFLFRIKLMHKMSEKSPTKGLASQSFFRKIILQRILILKALKEQLELKTILP
jgi:hypothetical protein